MTETEEEIIVLEQRTAESKPEEKGEGQEEAEEEEEGEDKENNCKFEEPEADPEEEIIRTLRRISALRETLSGLKKELQEEKDLWRKEKEEVERIRSSVGELDVTDAEVAKPVNEVRDIAVANTARRSSSEVVLPLAKEYEDKLTRFQEDFAKDQAKKQEQIFRTLAAQAYRQKLMEVDNLCNIELERLQQNAAILQPLMKIAQEWKLPPSEPIDGTAMRIVHNRSISSDRVMGSCNDVREQRALSEVRMSRTVADLGLAHCSRIHKPEQRTDTREVQSVVTCQENESSGDQHQLHIPRKPYTFVA